MTWNPCVRFDEATVGVDEVELRTRDGNHGLLGGGQRRHGSPSESAAAALLPVPDKQEDDVSGQAQAR
jgi:hypothetical protein